MLVANPIEVKNLSKSYGDFHAVKGIDLTVGEGEILAFLGPNGAGKTTTIEILEGYRKRSGGDVSVLGHDPQSAPLAWRERIGIVLQESEPIAELTARESLVMQAAYYSQPRNPDEVLEIVGLTESSDVRSRKLSGGQKRRLDLALALIGNPELVFLDEPTTGFDPSARRESWAMVEALRDLGTTVLLTTHYMDEAEHLADKIVVIAGGAIVAKGTAAELADQVQAKTKISWSASPGTIHFESAQLLDNEHVLEVEKNQAEAKLYELLTWARHNNVALEGLRVAPPNLEEIYLLLTNEEHADV